MPKARRLHRVAFSLQKARVFPCEGFSVSVVLLLVLGRQMSTESSRQDLN